LSASKGRTFASKKDTCSAVAFAIITFFAAGAEMDESMEKANNKGKTPINCL
jgi:hypothetical protein